MLTPLKNTVLKRCIICRRQFYAKDKVTRNYRSRRDIRKRGAITCSKICSKLYSRFKDKDKLKKKFKI